MRTPATAAGVFRAWVRPARLSPQAQSLMAAMTIPANTKTTIRACITIQLRGIDGDASGAPGVRFT